MSRFFVAQEELSAEQIRLTGENAAHAKVLRLKEGESVTVCDGQGREAICTVSCCAPGEYILRVEKLQASDAEAGVLVSVYMAMPKADKLEHVIQKATELGAYEVITFPTERCVSRPDEKSLQKKLFRWQKIAESAAEQSGRGRIPQIIVLDSYGKALKRAAQADTALVFYENEHSTTLHDALANGVGKTVSLLTGPEGGFEPGEITQAEDAGLTVCTLGKRILRCETAPLCALSAVMFAACEF